MQGSESSPVRLGDLGERYLVSNVLRPRYENENPHFGDDVASFGMTDGQVVATTDPAPIPAAWSLGDPDFFDWGWLLAAINLSDLAAAGARPTGLLTSLSLPLETMLSDFVRLLDGVDACCKTVGTRVRGGNLKETPHAVCEATALGVVPDGRPLSREGARIGDTIFAFGEVGAFWAAYLDLEQGSGPTGWRGSKWHMSALVRPRPLVELGWQLRQQKLANSCTDASDGLYAAIYSLTVERSLGTRIMPAEIHYSRRVAAVARALSINPLRLALGFGNMELVAAIDPSRSREAVEVASSLGVHATQIGTVIETPEILLGRGKREKLANFDNERFTQTSQFTAGLAGYKKHLLTAALGEADVTVSP